MTKLSNGIEVEQKFRLIDVASFEALLQQCGAVEISNQQEVDTYLKHPARDFRATDEALRIRQVGDWAVVTYKGPRKPGPVKVRDELEIPVVQHTSQEWLKIFNLLGFQTVADVCKTRRSFTLAHLDRRFNLTIDQVANVGIFAEIELLVQDQGEVKEAVQAIQDLAKHLKLTEPEQRSYLSMVLAISELP